jgi:hypothetical protein
MSAGRDIVTIDDAFHAALIVLCVSLMGAATLAEDTPPLPDSPPVVLRASVSVHGGRSQPDI